MRFAKHATWLCLIIGIGFLAPIDGFGDFPGGIMVFAWDSSSGGAPPPLTTAHLDGSISQEFGTNYLATFSGYYEAGTHSVEVSTEANGYVLRASPTNPDAVNDPYSEYGNPRYVEISESTNYVPVSFMYDPVITVSAIVRDAWTMERVENAAIEFVFEGSSGSIAVTKYPSTASYATNWVSNADGGFPANTILYPEDYDLNITKSGYQTFTTNDIITGPTVGDAIDLGTLFLQPIDNNANQIADAWEDRFFGAGNTVDADADGDGDGMSNGDEYIAGTDPTNWYSCLWVEATPVANDLELAWYVEPDRTYRVCGTTNLLSDNWVQVAGPWEATNGQLEMVWFETNMDLSWNNGYRVEVVPSGWQEANQILIKTNMPYGTGGGGTNGVVGPPLPEG